MLAELASGASVRLRGTLALVSLRERRVELRRSRWIAGTEAGGAKRRLLQGYEAGLLAILALALQLVGILALLLIVGRGLLEAEAATLAEVLDVTSWLRQRRLLAVVRRPGRVEEDAGGCADRGLIPVQGGGLPVDGGRALVVQVVLLRRGLLGLSCRLVALHVRRGDPEWSQELIWLPPRPPGLVPSLPLGGVKILLVEGPGVLGHAVVLRMVDEQSVLVLLGSQLSQCLVLEDRSLDDLHDLGLVEDACAQLRFDEDLNLRGAKYRLSGAGLQLACPHVRQLGARDDGFVRPSCSSRAALLVL